MDSERINRNLHKTAEIIDTVFTLKLSWVKARRPELDDVEARRLVYQGIVDRKDRQWTSRTES